MMRKKRKRTHSTVKVIQHRAAKIGTIAACFVVIAGCQPDGGLLSSGPASKVQQQQLKTVNVARIGKQKLGEVPELAADLQSGQQAEVTVTSGGIVEQLLKKRGDTVKKGEVILRLSSPDLMMERERALLSVKSAEQAIERSKQDRVNAKAEIGNSIQKLEAELAAQSKQYNKLRNDYDVGKATKAQVEQAEGQIKNLKMDLDLLRQKSRTADSSQSQTNLEVQLKNAQLNLQQSEQALEELEIKAPMDGVLTELLPVEGSTVGAGSRVGQIFYLERLKIKTQLNEEALKLVQGKSELNLVVPGSDAKVKGQVNYLAAFTDPQTKGYEIDLDVDNADLALKPGTKVRIQLADEQDQIAVAVPTFSIIREGEDAYVYVLSGETAEKRKVSLGRVKEPLQEVLSGVQEGELLVTSGQTMLKDRESVKVASMDGQKQGE